MQDVLDLLKEKRPAPVTASDIFAAKKFWVSDLPELQEQLRDHPNIEQTLSGAYVFKVRRTPQCLCAPTFARPSGGSQQCETSAVCIAR